MICIITIKLLQYWNIIREQWFGMSEKNVLISSCCHNTPFVLNILSVEFSGLGLESFNSIRLISDLTFYSNFQNINILYLIPVQKIYSLMQLCS